MNRCEEDLKRRERARRDSGVTERLGEMSRRIEFDVGYDHRAFPDDCGGGGHGQHGMEFAFLLQGPSGIVVWRVYLPNWVPGNVTEYITEVRGSVKRPSAITVPCKRDTDGIPADLGYHSPKPLWDGQEEYRRNDCHILPDGVCYYDGSGLNAAPVLEAFLEHGPHAVWATLARYYQELFGDA